MRKFKLYLAMEKEINSDLTFESQVKAKNKRIVSFVCLRISIVLVMFSCFLIYLLTPISSLQNLNLLGSVYYLDKEDIYAILNCDFPSKTSLYSVDVEKYVELIDEYEIIDVEDIELNPFSLNLTIKENVPSAFYGDSIYLSNGNKLSLDERNDPLIKNYFSKSLDSIVEIISVNYIENRYFSAYLSIVSGINYRCDFVEYIDFSDYQNTFYLYYKFNDSDTYFRVNLLYDDNYGIDKYVNYLSNINILNSLSSKCEDQEPQVDGDLTYKEVVISKNDIEDM